MGYAYGHFDNWRQHVDVAYLNSPGARHMAVLAAFMTAQKWSRLFPDLDMIVPGGAGSGAQRVVALSSVDHDEACVYFPGTQQGAALLLDRISARPRVIATWFDPRDGSSRPGGRYSSSEVTTFTPPSDWEDAVLLLQSDNEGGE